MLSRYINSTIPISFEDRAETPRAHHLSHNRISTRWSSRKQHPRRSRITTRSLRTHANAAATPTARPDHTQEAAGTIRVSVTCWAGTRRGARHAETTAVVQRAADAAGAAADVIAAAARGAPGVCAYTPDTGAGAVGTLGRYELEMSKDGGRGDLRRYRMLRSCWGRIVCLAMLSW
jgi:hypothetical protein